MQEFTGAENQKFMLKKQGSYYGIVTASSNEKSGFDVYEWSKENGGNINQWEYRGDDCQLFSLEPVHPAVADGSYSIRDISSDCLYNSSDREFGLDSYMQIHEINGDSLNHADDHIWKFNKLDDGSYTIINKYGDALTSDSAGNITAKEYTADSSQKFRVICNKDGSYSLVQNEKCVTVISNSSALTCRLEEYKGTENQKIILTPEKMRTGDVNYDTDVTVADLVMLQKFLLKNEPVTNSAYADINYDGVVDIFDSIGLRKLLITK